MSDWLWTWLHCPYIRVNYNLKHLYMGTRQNGSVFLEIPSWTERSYLWAVTHVHQVRIMIMRIHMSELGNAEVLARAINGRRVQAKLLELTDKGPTVPEPVFLDFAGVNVATPAFSERRSWIIAMP
jgi:hypothetical protein